MDSLQLVTKAAAFAGEAHVRQMRKTGDQPYVNHLLRTASEAAQAGLSPEAIAAALLHDVVEDTSVSLEDLEDKFPARVIRLVELLTKWWPDDAPQAVKAEGKPKYYGAILKDQEAIELKLLDRTDNIRDMIRSAHKVRSWAERYLKKTETEIEPIFRASRNDYVKNNYTDALRGLHRRLRELPRQRPRRK